MSRANTILIISSLLLVTSFALATNARADWLIDRSGTLVEIDGNILGDNDDSDEQEQEELESREQDEDRGDDSAQHQAEVVRERAKQRLETATEARIKSQETLKQRVKSKLEIKDGSIMEIRQEVEDENGRVVRRSDLEFEKGERLKIERDKDKFFELGSDSEGRFEIIHDRIKARTNFPISIGQNNELIITKPDGTTKVVSTLPDVAAENLRAKGFVLSDQDLELELEEVGSEAAYRFPVKQTKRFLGLFKRAYNQESVISAETGEILETTSTETAPFARFLEALSF